MVIRQRAAFRGAQSEVLRGRDSAGHRTPAQTQHPVQRHQTGEHHDRPRGTHQDHRLRTLQKR